MQPLPRVRASLWLTLGFLALLPPARAQNTSTKPLHLAEKRFAVTDFGAVGNGTTLNTAAIQKAIDAASANPGGGVVDITGGTFLSGSIFLKPGVELHLAVGAVLLGSTNIEDYPKRETRIEGHFEPWRMALVNAQELDGVRITGPGTLNGNGLPFWQAFWARRAANAQATNLEVERPRLLFIDRCRDVTIEGIRITIPTSLKTGVRGPSTDGIDVDSSQHYENITFDGITLKGTGRLINVAPWTQFFDLQGQPPPSREVNGITLKNVHGDYGSFGTVRGNAGDVLRDFTFENVDVKLTTGTANLNVVTNLATRNFLINGQPYTPPPATPPAPSSPPAPKAP